MDLSTFSKFEVTGRDANGFLDRIFANRIAQRDGGIMLGHLLTPSGYIESEITVTRLSADRFYLLSAAVAELHDLDQLHRRLKPDEQVTIRNLTSDYGCLVLAGPKSREALGKLTEAELSNAAFPWLTGKEIEVAGVSGVRALRVNYVGELGWELHVPNAGMGAVFDALMDQEAGIGMKLFGTYAMNSLRMEKAYRGWGSELTNEIDMFEGGMERFIRLDKQDFIGRQASLAHKQRGPRIRLVYLEVDAADADALGNEPIYRGDKVVGLTTSGAYGHAVKASLAFGYVEPDLAQVGETFEVLMLGERRNARIIPEPAYDPKNARLKA
jgi:dimethylglycine dehydrogenase